jgi:hypothetical protein
LNRWTGEVCVFYAGNNPPGVACAQQRTPVR